MPLNLGIETERPQLITYDPAIAAEVKDALARRASLVAQGFVAKKEEPGAIHLEPPPLGTDVLLFRVLSPNGDDRIVWDRTKPDQVKEAFVKFKEFIAKGFTAFAVMASGKKGHKISEFDPSLQEILLTVKEILMVPATMPG